MDRHHLHPMHWVRLAAIRCNVMEYEDPVVLCLIKKPLPHSPHTLHRCLWSRTSYPSIHSHNRYTQHTRSIHGNAITCSNSLRQIKIALWTELNAILYLSFFYIYIIFSRICGVFEGQRVGVVIDMMAFTPPTRNTQRRWCCIISRSQCLRRWCVKERSMLHDN